MTDPNVTIRYPVTWTDELELPPFTNDTTGDSPSNDIQLTDAEQSLVLQVTAEQFEQLLSSALNGSQRSFPENYIGVIWPLIKAGKLSFCLEVADCIENNSTTQQAIADAISSSTVIQTALQEYLNQNGYGGAGTPTTVSPDANDNNLLPVGYDCDDDNLFGMCMEIVDMVHQNTTELLQQIQAAAGDYLDLLNAVLDNIPAVEAVGIITEYVDWVINTVGSDYETAWSLSVQQEIACILFCRVRPDCNLSWDDIWQVYLDTSTLSAPSVDEFLDWANAIIAGSLGTGKQTVALVDLIGLSAMRFGGVFVDWLAGIRSMEQTILLAQDATDPDWSTLCTDCSSDDAYYVDFTTGLGDWTIEYGSQTGSGIESVPNGQPEIVTVYIEATASWQPSGIEVVYQRSSGGSFLDDLRVIQWTTFGDTGRSDWLEYDEPAHSDSEETYCHTGAPVAVSRPVLAVYLRDNTDGQTIYLKSIKVWPEPPGSTPNAESGCS